MKFLALFAILIAPSAYAADLVGSTIPPYPDGLIHKQGACIAASALGFRRSCDYSIGILEDAHGKPTIIFGARQAGRSKAGKAIWKVTDTMPYPSPPKGYFLSIATCTDDGRTDETVIAVVKIADTEWYEDALWARRYDMKSGKFIKHSAANVRCLNEGWGL